jgi:hypothetical protein
LAHKASSRRTASDDRPIQIDRALAGSNSATGEHFSITLEPPTGASFNGSSAEWIMEAPDGGEPMSSLPAFNPVEFTGASACGDGNVHNPQNGDTVIIMSWGVPDVQLTYITLGDGTVTIIRGG